MQVAETGGGEEKGGEPVSLNVSGDKQTVFYMVSPDTGLLYLYRVADSNFYQEYNETKRMFIIGYLVSIAFNLLVLAVITYYNNTAYRKRIQQVSRGAGLDISQDSRSFEGSLQVLTSEISSLHQPIDSSRALLFQSAIRSVILNKNTEMGYDKLEPYLTGECVCTFFRYLAEKDGLVAVIIASEQSMAAARKSFMKETKDRWNTCRMVSGRNCSVKKEGVRESYRTAAEAAKYRYIYTEESCLSYETLHLDKRKHSGSHLKLFEVMERDIANENFLNFKTRMEGLVVSFKSGDYGITCCNSTLRDLKDKIIRIIDENLETCISLDYLADELHMRPDAASRMFKQMMGKGYAEYIKEQKLNRAVRLMDEGYSVKDIAEQLGYSSSQYFINVFKEAYGITPHQFKKNRENADR